MKPLQDLSTRVWRDDAPDVPGWWFVTRNDGRGERAFDLGYQQDVDAIGRDWRAGWRCAPIPDCAEVERETRAAVVEECARVVEFFCEMGDCPGVRAAASAIRARFAPLAEAK